MERNDILGFLLAEAEKVFGRKPQSPTDFDALVESVFISTHQNVAVSTLKRMWGYVQTESAPRTSTLDILSQYVGYTSWFAFCDMHSSTEGKNIESNLIIGEHIDSEDLHEGDKVKVMWNPNRVCVFRSLGNSRFVVEESQNSKLSAGDTFTCHTFINGAPLYLTDLIMQSSKSPVTYVCGRDNGIMIVI